MSDLSSIKYWEDSFGLLPIKLFSNLIPEEKYIMLNGGDGDFCLQLQHVDDSENYFHSKAWSSNTKNFISIENNILNLYNWKKGNVEKIEKRLVEDNQEKFYKYLSQNSFKSENDVVPFVLNIYKKLRNLTNEKEEGVLALNMLFNLFALYEEGGSFSKLDIERWGIDKLSFSEDEVFKYFEEFNLGISGLKPDVELIVRHTSGVLFQETQREAFLFNSNVDLFGVLSGKFSSTKKMFTSTHYTPAFIARSIVEITLSKVNLQKEKLKILDPACGTSIFLMEILKQLKSKNYKGEVTITGWDISQSAINTSKFLLNYEKREWGDKLNINLEVVQDSLNKDWSNDYDVILMNPPYISWELMKREMQETTRLTLGNLFEKKPNQASAFFYKCIKSLNDDGYLGCIVPASLLTSDSYSKMRKEIKEYFSFSFIAKLGNYIFDNALTDVSIIIGQKSNFNIPPKILWTKNEKGIANDALRDYRKFKAINVSYVDKSEYSIYTPIKFPNNEENWKPLSYREEKQVRKIEYLVASGNLTRVKNIFNVQQGIRTGNNDVFKIPESQFLEYIPESEKIFFRPVIDNDSINKNKVLTVNYIWYPYDKDGLIIKTEEELNEKANYFYSEILLPNKAKLEKRAGINEWWGLTRPRNWQFEQNIRLISTEFGNSKSFAFDSKGIYVVERGNAWIPKKTFLNTEDYFFYLALFSSPLFEKLLSIYSKQLAGGKWYDLGKKHTGEIPIPILSKTFRTSSIYEALVMIGKKIHSGEFVDFQIIDTYLSKDIYLFDDL